MNNTNKGDMSTKTFILLIMLIFFMRIYIAEPHSVNGDSMTETFHDNDYLIVEKISYISKDPKQFDIIVFNPPVEGREKSRFIKRIIATPGQKVEIRNDGYTYIDNNKIMESYVEHKSNKTTNYTLGINEYFVMGDNRNVSHDSRYFGPIKKENIIGKVLFRLYPFDQIDYKPGF